MTTTLPRRARRLRPALATAGLTGLAGLTAVAALTTLAPPAQAVPERFADAGTIVWCDGEGGTLSAIDTTMAGTSWTGGLLVGDAFAFAGGEEALYDGAGLAGTFPAVDVDSGAELGDLVVDGFIDRGETEVLSGWDIDEDGRRTRSEGTRTPLSGSVILSLGATSVSLDCVGWEIDTELFRLSTDPAADRLGGWWADQFELGDGAMVGFYGERQTALGVTLDLADPYVFAGERLQVRNGRVEGTLLLRDAETWAVVGVASVSGSLTPTGTEQVVETGPGYRLVIDLAHYDVALTVDSDRGSWSGTFPATFETDRTLSVIPPAAL